MSPSRASLNKRQNEEARQREWEARCIYSYVTDILFTLLNIYKIYTHTVTYVYVHCTSVR